MEHSDSGPAAGQLSLPAGPGQQQKPPRAAQGEAVPEEEAVTVMAADAEHIEMGAAPMPSADEAAAAAAFAGQGGQRFLSPPGAPPARAPAAEARAGIATSLRERSHPLTESHTPPLHTQ